MKTQDAHGPVEQDSPLYLSLRRRIAHYEGGHLERLQQESQQADDEIDAMVKDGKRPTLAFQARADGKFLRFKEQLHEYERLNNVLRGTAKPNESDLAQAYELASVKAATVETKPRWSR